MTANSTDAQKLWGWLAGDGGDGGDGSRSGLIRQAPNDAGPVIYGDWLFSEVAGGSNADLTGATTLTFDTSAAAQGGASLSGSSALTFATAGDLTGTDPATDITGATSFAFATAGGLIGNATATGSTNLTFATTGAMTGSANISGAANLTFAPTGNLAGAGVLSGASTVTFAPAGSLVTFAALSGASSFAFTTGGILNGAALIGGASFPTFTLSGTLATGAALTGASAYQFTLNGSLVGLDAETFARPSGGWLPVIYVDENGKEVVEAQEAKAPAIAEPEIAAKIGPPAIDATAISAQIVRDLARVAANLDAVDAGLAEAAARDIITQRQAAMDEDIALILLLAS